MTLTWNPADSGSLIQLANGNRDVRGVTGQQWSGVRATASKTTGKWHIEFYVVSYTGGQQQRLGPGFADPNYSPFDFGYPTAAGGDAIFLYGESGGWFGSGLFTSLRAPGYGSRPYATGQTWAYDIDFDAGQIWLSKNNVQNGPGSPAAGTSPDLTFTPNTELFPFFESYSEADGTWQLPAAAIYAAPSGFSTWNDTAAGGGGTTTTLTPSSGSLALTGQTPTVAVSSNTTLAPSTGALALTGQQPTLTFATRLNPVTGSLALTGQSPSLATRLNPATGALATTGQTPVVTQGINLTPASGALVLTGQSPTLATGLFPATRALTLLGQIPALTTTYAPGTGAMTTTGQQPTVTVSAATVLNPSTGALSLSGQAAALITALSPSAGALSLSGQSPALLTAMTPGTGSLSLSGQSVAMVVGVSPSTGALAVSGQQPTVLNPVVVSPATGALTLSRQQPTISGIVVNPDQPAFGVSDGSVSDKFPSTTVSYPYGESARVA